MIKNEDIRKIIDDCKLGGHDIKVRDISYALLSFFYSDREVCYKSLFEGEPTASEMESYDKSASISFLRAYLKQNHLGNRAVVKSDSDGSITEDMSFDENKAAMINLIHETERAMRSGEVEKKDGLKIIADLRVKLNDKFNIQEDIKDNLVVVESKYNAICPYCSHEIRVPTKEELMEEYKLIEK